MKNKSYNTIIDTASFIASKGDIELALKLIKSSLEKLYYEKQIKMEGDSSKLSELSEMEIELRQKYYDYRSDLDERKTSYFDLFKKTSIISAVISLSMIITTSVIFYQTKEVLISDIINSVEIEVKEVVNQINVAISELTNVVKSEIPLITNEIRLEISSSFEKINEQIPIASDRVTDKIVKEIESLPKNLNN